MRNEQARTLLDDATLAVQTGRFEDALPLVEQVLTLDPNNYEAFVVRGIALSQTNKPNEATEAFRKAIELRPGVPKSHYNLALHLSELGKNEEALTHARRAMELDPKHENSQSLALKIERDLGMAAPAGTDFRPQDAKEFSGDDSNYQRGPETSTHYREGFDSDPTVHSIPLVEKLGASWFLIGCFLAGFTFVVFGIGFAFGAGMLGGVFTSFSQAPGTATALLIARVIFAFLGMLWLIMDALDRRVSLLWILPFVFCCCFTAGGLQGIIMILYMVLGRRQNAS